jgi:hypothetical protein
MVSLSAGLFWFFFMQYRINKAPLIIREMKVTIESPVQESI